MNAHAQSSHALYDYRWPALSISRSNHCINLYVLFKANINIEKTHNHILSTVTVCICLNIELRKNNQY